MTADVPEPITRIITSHLFEPTTRKFIQDQVITINERLGLVIDVQTYEGGDEDLFVPDKLTRRVIDLRGKFVLPGLVDAHSHLFLHSYVETSWDDQLTKESFTERIVRATNHARDTLMAGFTAIRDCGTEGAEDADVQLRKCLTGPNPLIPGPRYFCCSKAIVTSGSYGPKNPLYTLAEGIQGVMGATVADGVDECRRAVRKHIGAGADWVKIYSGYRVRSRLVDTHPHAASRTFNTFSREELAVMIDTAHQLDSKVTAHTMNGANIAELVALGIDCIEHGADILEDGNRLEDVTKWLTSPGRLTWVPTLAVYHELGRSPNPSPGDTWPRLQQTFKTIIQHAQRAGQLNNLRIGVGGDTGAFSHGDNALELKLMVKLGVPWRYVLSWATLGNWNLIKPLRDIGEQDVGSNAKRPGDNEVPFGKIAKGWAADIVASTGDFERDFELAVDKGSIDFVMKAGRVYKENGRLVL